MPWPYTPVGIPLHRARWPNLLPAADVGNSTRLAWATTGEISAADPGLTNTSFTYDASAPFGTWEDWSDVWAHGLWYFDWNDLLSPVAGVDAATRTIHLAPPYPSSPGITGGARYWLENSFDALDSPGEFWLNSTSGMLYFIPPVGVDGDAEVTRLIYFFGFASCPQCLTVVRGLFPRDVSEHAAATSSTIVYAVLCTISSLDPTNAPSFAARLSLVRSMRSSLSPERVISALSDSRWRRVVATPSWPLQLRTR